MDGRIVRIGLVQMACGIDPLLNLKHAEIEVGKAIKAGAEIICLPELFSHQYFPRILHQDVLQYAEPVPGPITSAFKEIARQHEVVIIVPLFEKSPDGRFFNSAVIIDADGTVNSPYHKVHIPHDPMFWEKGYFHPGESFQVIKTRYANIAALICYDQWFPEAARSVALMGADIIFYPTAIGHIGDEVPVEGDWRESWEIIQRSHAIANSIHIAAVNRVGWEEELFFFGGSFICDSFGKVMVRAGTEETVAIASVDLDMNQQVRSAWGFFRNRRPETYLGLCKGIPDSSGLFEGTPRSKGFHMPAEWEPHEAVWISWPHDSMTFPRLCEVETAYVQFIFEVCRSERIELLVPSDKILHHVKTLLSGEGIDLSRIVFRLVQYADVWIRDYGPIFLVNRPTKTRAMVRWNFNAWGNKYDGLVIDREIPGLIKKWFDLPLFSPGIVLEGGSIDVNGKGTLLTTRSCLLNQNRNPDLSIFEIEEYLEEYFGVTKIIWLNEGIAGDDTDGHVDDIARFVSYDTVVCAWEEDPTDENYSALLENYEILSHATDQDGNPLRIIRIPMPSPVKDEYERYPASYMNFYIGNDVVIVPVFNDSKDEEALHIIGELFPDRRVIGIDARAMVEGYGTFHCATQQQPF